MTSNIGSHILLEDVQEEGAIGEGTRERVMSLLRNHFRPEFVNRIDEVILFKPLTTKEMTKKLLIKMSVELQRRLSDRDIELQLTAGAKAFIAAAGFDPLYGARPLKRYMQRQIETKLARELIAGHIQDHSTVIVDEQSGELVLKTI
ncbi:hypothetical protein GCM10020331_078890 [Ectobacillus funiculus]